MSAVIGYHSTNFGELWDKSLTDLVKETVKEILKQTYLDIKEIDAIFFGNMLSGILENNLHFGAKIAESLGVNIPAFRAEAACASGGVAFYLANQFLDSHPNSTVMVVGAEKMTDYSSELVTQGLAAAASGDEQEAGLTFPGLYALMARSYLETYNYNEESLAVISVKNHYHASFNPKAQFPKKISVEQVLASQYVASPLKVLDCSPISDGAASLILTNRKDLEKKLPSVNISATYMATDTISLKDRSSLLEIKSTKIAGKQAFKKAKITPREIQIAELHDCFTIAEILGMESLGFWESGLGGRTALDYPTQKGSNSGLVVNISGGLKAAGHPVGATGVKQIGVIYEQLISKENNFQNGLAQNIGGSGGTSVVTILQV